MGVPTIFGFLGTFGSNPGALFPPSRPLPASAEGTWDWSTGAPRPPRTAVAQQRLRSSARVAAHTARAANAHRAAPGSWGEGAHEQECRTSGSGLAGHHATSHTYPRPQDPKMGCPGST